MSVRDQIADKLTEALAPSVLDIVDETRNHNVPPDGESHFRVTIVSAAFADDRLLARHRRVNRILADELGGPVHALALHTYTPGEWAAREGAPESPPCLGGSGR